MDYCQHALLAAPFFCELVDSLKFFPRVRGVKVNIQMMREIMDQDPGQDLDQSHEI